MFIWQCRRLSHSAYISNHNQRTTYSYAYKDLEVKGFPTSHIFKKISASTLSSGIHSTKGSASTMPDPKSLINFYFINLSQIISLNRILLYE
jgi:hypothetical protein